MNKKVVITQSNYIPWKGYFDAIAMADVFVLYDDMQYTKRDWRNRNKIKTPQGLQWISIPVEVKGKFFQKINETKVSNSNWGKEHWKTISMNYSKALFFNDYKDIFENLYLNSKTDWLTEINYTFIVEICKILGIQTDIKFSNEFELLEEKTERLVGICKQLDAQVYYSGPSAKAYMNEKLFIDSGIEIQYFDYSNYPEYNQLYPPFEHSVSVLDLIFNEGKNALNYTKVLKNG